VYYLLKSFQTQKQVSSRNSSYEKVWKTL